MTSRTEWQRLQNLRYLSKKLGTILTNQQQTSSQDNSQINSQNIPPLLTTIDTHNPIDSTINMHEPGD
jgi:hypothetical protein